MSCVDLVLAGWQPAGLLIQTGFEVLPPPCPPCPPYLLALQIAGIAVIALAITGYMVLQWLAARAADGRATAAVAAPAGGADAAQPVGMLVGMTSDSGIELVAARDSKGSSIIDAYLSRRLSTVSRQLSHLSLRTISRRTRPAVPPQEPQPSGALL